MRTPTLHSGRIAVSAVVVASMLISACSWTQYRGDGRHSGVNAFAPGVDSSTLGGLHPAWTSADRGYEAEEVVTRDGRVFAAGADALRALDANTGAELWHVDRTFGHQVNDLTAASTWSAGPHGTVAMNQGWSDAIAGTPFFQSIGRVTQLDAANGTALHSDPYGGPVPPLESDGWVYFLQEQIVALPTGSAIHVELEARPLAPTATGFSVPLTDGIRAIFDVASDGTNLHIRTRDALLTVPARGCGAPTCAPLWTDDPGAVQGPSRVAIGGQAVVTATDTTLRAFAAAGCGRPTCAPTWSASAAYGITGVAVTADRVYATAGPVLSVFATAGCGAATCAPLWTSTVTGTLSAPSVVNDVVLAGTADGHLVAWRTTGCGVATCPVLFSRAEGGAVGPVSPTGHALLFAAGGRIRMLVPT